MRAPGDAGRASARIGAAAHGVRYASSSSIAAMRCVVSIHSSTMSKMTSRVGRTRVHAADDLADREPGELACSARGVIRRAASAKTMPCSGIGSGSGVSARSHASVQAVRSWRAGLPVIDRERTVSRDVAASSFSTAIGFVSASATVSQIEPVHTPCAPSASAAAIWRPVADPAGREHRHVGPDRVDDLGDEHHRRDVAAVAAGLGALGDDDVDALRDLPLRVLAAADERADEQPVLVRVVDDVRRRRPERVHEHLHARVRERHLDLARALLVDVEAGGLHHARRRGPSGSGGTSCSSSSCSTNSRCSAGSSSSRLREARLVAAALARRTSRA